MDEAPATLRVRGHHHLAIQVHDLGRAERFYTEVLGLRVLRRWPWSAEDLAAGKQGERSLWVALGATGSDFLALEACDELPISAPFRDARAGLHLFALRIDAKARKQWETHLLAHGIEVVNRSRWTIYLRDPEGNRIGLSHHPDDGGSA